MTYDWELLRAFARVVDAGSLTGAAKLLGLSQPTLSRHVAELEEQLGVELFVRHARGLSLTDRGAELVAGVREIDERVQGVFRRAAGLRDTPRGTVRVSAGEPIGVNVLGPAFARLRRSYPEVALELVVDNGPSNLSRREADLAVRMFRPTQLDLVASRVGEVPLGFYATRGYVEAFGEPRGVADVQAHTLVGFDRDPSFARVTAGFGLTPRDFRFRTDHVMAQIEAVRAGVGIGVLHCRMGDTDPDLVRVLVDVALPPLECWLVTHEDVRHSPAVAVVREALRCELEAYLACV